MTETSTSGAPVAAREFTTAEAVQWQREVNRRTSMILEPASAVDVARLRQDPMTYDHSYSLRDLTEACNSSRALSNLLSLHHTDPELERTLQATLHDALWEMDNPDSTVTGIVVQVIQAILRHHSYLQPYAFGIPRRYPRRVKEIEAEIESGRLLALSQLNEELDLAREMEATAISSSDQQ